MLLKKSRELTAYYVLYAVEVIYDSTLDYSSVV